MTERTTQEYFTRLDSALVGVDPGVRAEIVSGIREELAGLDDQSAAARIAEMDDPALIAAEARAATPSAAMPLAAPPIEPAPGRALSLTGVLVLILGSFFVPVIGPLVGLVWVTMSSAWTRREKVVAWLLPVAVGLVVAATVGIVSLLTPEATGDVTEPALQATIGGGWHLALLVPYFVLPIEGIVLLVRASRRGWRRPR
jgi:4-amino-4-deoxy-L-arabinose transferase-like glycosyltransferase